MDVLLERLNRSDILIVVELSRLGRAVGQIAIIVNPLVETGVRLVCIKENMDLNGKKRNSFRASDLPLSKQCHCVLGMLFQHAATSIKGDHS